MNETPKFLADTHDPKDPNPWRALYLDQSTPIDPEVKRAWLKDSSSKSRQFLLPVVRPIARGFIILIQLVRIVLPNALSSSRVLHNLLVWGLRNFVTPEANWLILRHFHIGSENLDFIARNVPGVKMTGNPLCPRNLEDLRDHLFLKHDLNIYNFIIELNQQMQEKGLQIGPVASPDFGGISDKGFALDELPNRWTNVIDLETAIELFTPMYQLFMTDNDFWRATNSLQLDEPIGIYAARILNLPEGLFLVNNKHPMVSLSTLRAGFRLVLHGLSSEMLHAILVLAKQGKLRRVAEASFV